MFIYTKKIFKIGESYLILSVLVHLICHAFSNAASMYYCFAHDLILKIEKFSKLKYFLYIWKHSFYIANIYTYIQTGTYIHIWEWINKSIIWHISWILIQNFDCLKFSGIYGKKSGVKYIDKERDYVEK